VDTAGDRSIMATTRVRDMIMSESVLSFRRFINEDSNGYVAVRSELIKGYATIDLTIGDGTDNLWFYYTMGAAQGDAAALEKDYMKALAELDTIKTAVSVAQDELDNRYHEILDYIEEQDDAKVSE